LNDAQDEAESTRGAHAKLRTNLGEVEDQHLAVSNQVPAAVDCVLRASAERFLDEAEGAVQSCANCCRRTHDCLGSNVAVSARPILDNELLAKALRQPLT
jgi:hypothetical protein